MHRLKALSKAISSSSALVGGENSVFNLSRAISSHAVSSFDTRRCISYTDRQYPCMRDSWMGGFGLSSERKRENALQRGTQKVVAESAVLYVHHALYRSVSLSIRRSLSLGWQLCWLDEVSATIEDRKSIDIPLPLHHHTRAGEHQHVHQ